MVGDHIVLVGGYMTNLGFIMMSFSLLFFLIDDWAAVSDDDN